MEVEYKVLKVSDQRKYVAVASTNGLLVNAHLGVSKKLFIYKKTALGFRFVELRTTPSVGTGDFRWINLANVLKDCEALLVNNIGDNPANVLKQSGLRIIKMAGLIDEGLDVVFNKKDELQVMEDFY